MNSEAFARARISCYLLAAVGIAASVAIFVAALIARTYDVGFCVLLPYAYTTRAGWPNMKKRALYLAVCFGLLAIVTVVVAGLRFWLTFGAALTIVLVAVGLLTASFSFIKLWATLEVYRVETTR
jgi:hypothetical protein